MLVRPGTVFPPVTTDRLRIRLATPADARALHERRNDARVAEFQAWSLPYHLEQAQRLIAGLLPPSESSDVRDLDGWWMLTVEDVDSDTIYGDLAVEFSWDGRAAEIGYTFAPQYWGRGYATEAAEAVVNRIFSLNLAESQTHDTQPESVEHQPGPVTPTRIQARLHPDNGASARVVERLGFVLEGRTRLSYWVDGENSDDLVYGLTRGDWVTWRSRPLNTPANVRFAAISQGSVRDVAKIRTHPSQERFVSPVANALGQALYPPKNDGVPAIPWLRSVEADNVLAGFVMLAKPTEQWPNPILWRLLVDRCHQRRGIGGQVLRLVYEQCRVWGATQLEVSWVEGPGSPRPFYERNGFVPTGRIIDGETEAIRQL